MPTCEPTRFAPGVRHPVKTHRFRGARPPRGSARSAPVQRGSSCHRHRAEDETVLGKHRPANAGHRAHQSAGTLPKEGHPPAAPTQGGSTPSASSPTAAPPIPLEPQRMLAPRPPTPTGGRPGHQRRWTASAWPRVLRTQNWRRGRQPAEPRPAVGAAPNANAPVRRRPTNGGLWNH